MTQGPKASVLEAQAKTRGYGCEAKAAGRPLLRFPCTPAPARASPGGTCPAQRPAHAVPTPWELGEGLRDSAWPGVRGWMAQWHAAGLPKTTRPRGPGAGVEQALPGSRIRNVQREPPLPQGLQRKAFKGWGASTGTVKDVPLGGNRKPRRPERPVPAARVRVPHARSGHQDGLPRTGPNRPPVDPLPSQQRRGGLGVLREETGQVPCAQPRRLLG